MKKQSKRIFPRCASGFTLWFTPSMTATTKVVTATWTPIKPRNSRHSLANPRTTEVSSRTVVEVETTIGISL